MRNDSLLTRDAVRWLARLPFLGVHDLALLTGQPEPDVEGVLREMKQDWLVDAVTPSSPELDGAPLHILTEPTRRWLRSTLDGETARTLPLAWRDIVHGLARLEATVALNAFAADVVASLHRSADGAVADFHSLPVRRPQDARWPPGVQGYGCIRAVAGAAAPFFVFVDRAGAPSAHRAALIAGWHRFRDSRQPWGYDIPPIVVLCPGKAREGEWARAVLASAERRDSVPLRVLLTTVVTGTGGFGLRIWQPVAGPSRAALMEWLPVRHSDHLALSSAPLPDLRPPTPGEEHQPLHRWAREVATGARNATTVEDTAANALTTSMVEKRLTECLARHPLLSEPDLATVLHRDRRLVRSAVERATTQGLIAHVERSDERCPRYCLASAGLRVLALRDGVPVRRYARHAPVTVLPANDDHAPTLLQQYEHTVGANSFFLAWLDGPPSGPHLLSWLSAAESAIRFESGGRRRWLRPDGAGAVLANGVRRQFLLEWDRGSERLPVIASKLARYAEFFQTRSNHGDGSPTLLLVTTTPHREELVRRVGVATIGSSSDQFMTTTAPLLDRYGPFGAVWRGPAGQARTRWPGSATGHHDSRENRQ